jgi:hypothetical protein
MIEDQAFVFADKNCGIPESRDRLRRAFGPAPLPDRIKVSVADEMNPELRHP